MTADRDCFLCAAAAEIWEAGLRGELPEPRHDEGTEQRMSFLAETYDDETNTSRPLGPRRDRP